MAMRTLTDSQTKVKSYKIHLMEMVINAIYYNPVRSSNHIASTVLSNARRRRSWLSMSSNRKDGPTNSLACGSQVSTASPESMTRSYQLRLLSRCSR
jgi:hypothetical protein